MMSDEQLIKMANSIEVDDINLRRHLIVSYVDDKLEDIRAVFYAELLKNEKDDMCKWYEILALGDLKAIEYANLLINVICRPDVPLSKETSLHLIAARSLGKMGDEVIDLLVPLLERDEEYIRVAVMDTFGEIKSEKALPYIQPIFKEVYSKVVVYAGLAVAKIGIPSIGFVDSVFDVASDKNKVVLIDAIMGMDSDESYSLLRQIFNNYCELSKSVINLNTKNISDFKCKILKINDSNEDVKAIKSFIKTYSLGE